MGLTTWLGKITTFYYWRFFFLEIIEQLISADTRFIYEGFSICDNNLYLDKLILESEEM